MEQHGWQQPIRYLVVALIFVAIIWFVVAAQQLISSLVIAALLAYTLHPLVNLIMRRTSASHTAAVAITYILFMSVLIAIPAILTPVIIRQASGISFDVEDLLQATRDLINQPLKVGDFIIPVNNVLSGFEQAITQTTTFIASGAVTTLGGITTNLLWILVILVSIFYLLKDGHLLINWLLGWSPLAYQRHFRLLVNEIDGIWSNFLRGQLLLMLIIGVLSWLGGVAVGLPGAFIIGVIAGVLDLIPSLGPTLAAIIAVAVAFLEGSSYLPISNFLFGTVILTIFLVIQQVENIWIRPALMGYRLKLHPGLIFIGVFSSLALFGILTALIVIPVMASIGAVGRYIHCRIRGIDPYPENINLPPAAPSTPSETPVRGENATPQLSTQTPVMPKKTGNEPLAKVN